MPEYKVILHGWEAIEYAGQNAGTCLHKYNDPIEEAREWVPVEEAEEIAGEDPSLIWCYAPGVTLGGS